MVKKYFTCYWEKIKSSFIFVLQRLFITIEQFTKNGLMNHAAACAFGFLLSAAPALLFVSFVLSRAFAITPESVEVFFGRMEPLFGAFDVNYLLGNFLGESNYGLAGLVSIVTIFWTTRLCALSIQRGLNIIFPGSRSLVKENAIVLGIGLFAMVILIVSIVGFRFLVALFNTAGIMPAGAFAQVLMHSTRLYFLIGITALVMAAYRFFPANPPELKKIIPGVLVCIILQGLFASVFSNSIDPDRYNLLYGTLGRLFLFLMNIYFFFAFFFLGAQLTKTLSAFDAFLFIRFRQVHSSGKKPKTIFEKIFSSAKGALGKYEESYKEGANIFTRDSTGQEVYYILSGTAGVYRDKKFQNRVAVVGEGSFFGEMASITKDGRAASIKAESDITVLTLPPDLFSLILDMDPDTDQHLIKALSQQLKSVN